jgi:A-macroglobulin TED domain/Alpha-2-macroglobulin family/Carboxypeptidase regulatory-like domain/Alpha-2-macroglobulin bait region domain
LVRETERRWDYEQQKWNIEEGREYKGETDADGVFRADINLEEEFSNFLGQHPRFADLSYTAYATDPTTKRTEEKRLRLRLTSDAIHVYVIASGRGTIAHSPLRFFVTTVYADGAPAQCRVAIRQVRTESEASVPRRGRLLRTVETNRYGVSRVDNLNVKWQSFRSRWGVDRGALLTFIAEGDAGKTGRYGHRFALRDADDPPCRLETGKTLYRPGESIQVTLTSNKSSSFILTTTTSESDVIDSRQVTLRDGHAKLTVPYNDRLRGEVTITAYSLSEGRAVGVSRRVVFPNNRELTVEIRPTQQFYRPSDEASVGFTIRAPGGRAVESVLGVAAVDKAVEGRVRGDSDFANGYVFSRRPWEYKGDELAGFQVTDLLRLDTSKPFPEGLDVVADILLNRYVRSYPRTFGGSDIERDASSAFTKTVHSQLEPIMKALDARYARTDQYPRNRRELLHILSDFSIDFASTRDPWGTAYRALFSLEGSLDRLEIRSAGADKQFGTSDDFTATRNAAWPYLRPLGKSIDRAIARFHSETGGFVRDRKTLRRALLPDGLNLDAVRDRWGRQYRIAFGIESTHFTVVLTSGGPDRRFESNPQEYSDDFTIWISAIDYFAETRAKIDRVLNDYYEKTGRFPEDQAELDTMLREGSPDLQGLRDPWGRRLYTKFETEARYADRVELYSYARYPGPLKHRTEVTPVTQQIKHLTFRSAGVDGLEGSQDDFTLATFSRIAVEFATRQTGSKPGGLPGILFDGFGGAVRGRVADQWGAVVAGVHVTITNQSSLIEYQTFTDNEGVYTLKNTPPGTYTARFVVAGFRRAIITDVPVYSMNVTALDAVLEPAAGTETVTVTAGGAPLVETDRTSIEARQVADLPANAATDRARHRVEESMGPVSTPRLREDFPETLLWQPSVETDSSGHAELRFKLADNITTWRIDVLASTREGLLGSGTAEITSFQPFFIEHSPPRILTQGDQIELPVVLRNYLDNPLSIDLAIQQESWFNVLGPTRTRVQIPARDATVATFSLRTAATVENGRQRITAAGADAGDAVEKKVSVHPDGEKVARLFTATLSDPAILDVEIPANAIAGSTRGELRIYPRLVDQVLDSVEGMMQIPHGCAEQTISASYPSLLALRLCKTGHCGGLRARAIRYLQTGYDALINYMTEDGGFSYWGRGEADPALTAYAIQFLMEAREFISVDDTLIEQARRWVERLQQPGGRWIARDWQSSESERRSALLTAMIARALARTALGSSKDDAGPRAKIQLAIDYLDRRVDEVDEPYLAACLTLAAQASGNKTAALHGLAKLRSMAREEGSAVYWTLEANTPFYGWGLAGRVETTALAVQALNGPTGASNDAALVDRGLTFLLKHKDGRGVWLSTQATVTVLDALVGVLSVKGRSEESGQGAFDVYLNDSRIATLTGSTGDVGSTALSLDISRGLASGMNRIEVRPSKGSPWSLAEAEITHWREWPASEEVLKRESAHNSESPLNLHVRFDKTTARINDEIGCTVEVERRGFRGYGMMVAEIGLPPGAEIDRESLDRSIAASGWEVDHYDILPDLLLAYVWPRAGGTRFEFKFRPRFGMTAKTAPSLAYDYYNPAARAVVPPATFVIR